VSGGEVEMSVNIDGIEYVKASRDEVEIDAICLSKLIVENIGKGAVLITLDDDPSVRLTIEKGCRGELSFTRVRKVTALI
jgi:hypothetical protein